MHQVSILCLYLLRPFPVAFSKDRSPRLFQLSPTSPPPSFPRLHSPAWRGRCHGRLLKGLGRGREVAPDSYGGSRNTAVASEPSRWSERQVMEIKSWVQLHWFWAGNPRVVRERVELVAEAPAGSPEQGQHLQADGPAMLHPAMVQGPAKNACRTSSIQPAQCRFERPWKNRR